MADDRLTTPVPPPDAGGRLAGVPVVSEHLVQVADTLAALAKSLHGVAASLRASEAMDLRTAARAEFQANDLLSIVSHDLLAPLTAMSGNASLIREHAPADGDRSLYTWADDILRSAGVMERLIGDLDATTFDAPPVGELHDLGTLIGHVVEIFRPVAANTSLALTSEVAGPLPASYDSPKMFEVLAHLIENAIKFTPQGGSIRVAAARQDVECVVSVADTGVGIPAAQIPTLFEPFQEPTGRQARGVGLYISRWIVEAHGGRIWSTSQVGVGSTFYFALPVAE